MKHWLSIIVFLTLVIVGCGTKDDPLRELKAQAEKGDAEAQLLLGLKYEYGDGVTKNYPEALKWVRAAAEQGYVKAQNELGLKYYLGRGVMLDYEKAVMWYKKAAEQGYSEAQSNLGVMYSMGDGVKQDYDEASKWYRRATGQGPVEDQDVLDEHYGIDQGVVRNDSGYVNQPRNSDDQDFDELLESAESGNAVAQYDVGVKYLKGQDVDQDFTEAFNWFKNWLGLERANRWSDMGLRTMYIGD